MTFLRERGAVVSYHDPHVPQFSDTEGLAASSVPLDQLLSESDLVIVVTAHAAIDWAAVYDRAALVVDTVNSSRGHVGREGQVLRLGAGWTAPGVPQAE
jgi:UDP-N-acetyl-D-glucosamine dehydrogenase